MARKTAAAVLGVLGLPAQALADSGIAPIDPDSPSAERISDIYWFIFAIAVVIFLTVSVPLVSFIVRYRSRGRGRAVEGPQIHGSTRLELAWTAAPVLILVAIASFVFYKLPGIDDPAGAAGQPSDLVRVEGRQFYWQFVYPNGVITINKLRLPADRQTRLEITAPKGDVIHSFWIPTLHGKLDAIPGQSNTLKVVPREPGLHPIHCGEFCGIQHAAMRGNVEVLEPDAFDAWLRRASQSQRRGQSDLGRQIFEGACQTCHGVGGKGFIGPALAGNPIVAQPAAVEQVVREGRNTMPAVGQGWSDEEMKALLAYLRRNVAQQGGSGGGQG